MNRCSDFDVRITPLQRINKVVDWFYTITKFFKASGGVLGTTLAGTQYAGGKPKCSGISTLLRMNSLWWKSYCFQDACHSSRHEHRRQRRNTYMTAKNIISTSKQSPFACIVGWCENFGENNYMEGPRLGQLGIGRHSICLWNSDAWSCSHRNRLIASDQTPNTSASNNNIYQKLILNHKLTSPSSSYSLLPHTV